jgi:hypothetical protein
MRTSTLLSNSDAESRALRLTKETKRKNSPRLSSHSLEDMIGCGHLLANVCCREIGQSLPINRAAAPEAITIATTRKPHATRGDGPPADHHQVTVAK